MIKAVLFDMDGVLVDTEWFYNRRRVAYLDALGAAPSEAIVVEGSSIGIEAGKRAGCRVFDTGERSQLAELCMTGGKNGCKRGYNVQTLYTFGTSRRNRARHE